MTRAVLGGILGITAAGAVAAALTNPANVATMLAGGAGVVFGASAAAEVKRKREAIAIEAVRVSENFKQLYENNRGLINPQQLSLLSDIPLERAVAFLEALSKDQQGSLIPSDKGVVFSFPHPQNVLQQLTDNANAWVKSQLEPLQAQNATLKQQLTFYELRDRAATTPTQPAPAIADPSRRASENTNEGVDPWSKLL